MAPAKAKPQKMGLGEFLTDKTLGSWADEMEDMPMPSPSGRTGYGGGDRSYSSTGGFGSNSSYADRGYSTREQLPLPTKPPYTVHLGNMSFDATEGDITDFFIGCEVTSVRIVEDKLDRKPKGFGYAEFASLDGLKKSLELNGLQFQGRNIRISVAEPQKDRPDARTFDDWTRKGPLPDIAGQRKVSDRGGFGERSFSNRSFDNYSEAGSDRGSRRPVFEGDGKVRDFGNWERKGPLAPTVYPPTSKGTDRPISHDGPRDRRSSPAWGEGRSEAGSRPPRREFVERPAVERAPTAAEADSQWRTKMKPDAPAAPPVKSPIPYNKDISTPPSPAASSAPVPSSAPASRPKLNLQKRTVSVTESNLAPESATSDAKASPFGAAKPIDTAAREKEIDEKRQLAAQQKKEADDKAREEKRVADEKAREEKRAADEKVREEKAAVAKAKEAEKSQKSTEKGAVLKEKSNVNGQDKEKENGVKSPAAGRNYEILRRAANEENAAAADEEADENAEGIVTEDKAVKPKEITRDMPEKQAEAGASMNGGGATNGDTATGLEEEGWSTVSKPMKQRKGGNQTTRALAS